MSQIMYTPISLFLLDMKLKLVCGDELDATVEQVLHFVDAHDPMLCCVRLLQHIQLKILQQKKNPTETESHTTPLSAISVPSVYSI